MNHFRNLVAIFAIAFICLSQFTGTLQVHFGLFQANQQFYQFMHRTFAAGGQYNFFARPIWKGQTVYARVKDPAHLDQNSLKPQNYFSPSTAVRMTSLWGLHNRFLNDRMQSQMTMSQIASIYFEADPSLNELKIEFVCTQIQRSANHIQLHDDAFARGHYVRAK